MSKKRVYVAGKMSGLPNYGFEFFDRARDALIEMGYDVVSPADIDREEGFTGQDVASDEFRQLAMRRDIIALAACDYIWLLPGWQDSPGARLEYAYAQYVGIPLLNPPKIIGLSGFAQAGKDTLATFLVEDYGYRRIAFADALKTIAYESSGFVARMVDAVGWTEAKKDTPIRKFLQDLGVSVRENIGANTWVNSAMRLVEPGGRYVITDLRFPSELEAIRAYDSTLYVRIERPGVGAVNGHISETALSGFPPDLVVQNDGTIYDLKATAEELVRQHERRAGGRGAA